MSNRINYKPDEGQLIEPVEQASPLLDFFDSFPKWAVNLVGPPPGITNPIDQLRSIFVSILALCCIPVFLFLQASTSTIPQEVPLYSALAVVLAGVYLLSRTNHFTVVRAIVIITFALIPFLILILSAEWSVSTILTSFLSVPVAILIASYLLNRGLEAIFVVLYNAVYILYIIQEGVIQIFFSIAPSVPLVSVTVLTLVGSLARDIYTTQLEKKNHMLTQKSRELEVYNSLLTHDIGNDLQLILGELELACILLPSNQEQICERLEIALASGERMRRLIEVFWHPLDYEKSDFASFVKRIAQQAERANPELHVSIEHCGKSEETIVPSGLLAMALDNLLRNAVQHAGEEPEVCISIEVKETNVEILVADNGPGIDDSLKEILFQKGTTTGGAGRGLGLYIVRKIIELLGGTIGLVDDSKMPGGTFKLEMPVDSVARW